MSTENKIKKEKKPRSLRFTLAINFLSLALILLIAFGAFDVYSDFQTQQKVLDNEEKVIADGAANTVNNFIQEKFNLLETVSNFGDLDTINQEEQKSILDKLLGVEPSFRQIVLLNERGDGILRTSRLSTSLSIQLMEYNKAELFYKVNRSERYIGPVYIDNISGEPMIVMAVPIRDILGNFKGAVMAETNLKFMWELVSSIKVGDEGFAYVVDKDGNLTAFGDISRVLKRENLKYLDEVAEFTEGSELLHEDETEIKKGINNNYVATTHAHVDITDWAVVVELPVFEAYEDLIFTLELSGVMTLIVLASIIVFSMFISKRITEPIIKLRDAAVEIGKGNLDTKIEIEARNEIGDLAYTFSQMTKDLKISMEKIEDYSKGLEKKVGERTAELKEKINELTKTKTALLNMMNDLDNANKSLLEAQGKLKISFGELKKLDEEKDEFISIAAHELKTPMTAIHGFSQLLQNENITNKSEMRGKYLNIIEKEIKRLSKLVTEILDLSRLDLGTMKFAIEDVNLVDLTEEIKDMMTQRTNSAGLDLSFKIDQDLPIIKTDKERLKEILINLIDNAVKYTEKGGISVEIQKDNAYVQFSVTDTGIGIEERNFNKIFKRFSQIESPLTRKVGGSGLGLSICKEIVEAMGGKIWFKSKFGEGTTFYFTLPLEFNSESNKKMG